MWSSQSKTPRGTGGKTVVKKKRKQEMRNLTPENGGTGLGAGKKFKDANVGEENQGDQEENNFQAFLCGDVLSPGGPRGRQQGGSGGGTRRESGQTRCLGKEKEKGDPGSKWSVGKIENRKGGAKD